MKTTIFLFLLTFFLCVFNANAAPSPVLDGFGKNLRAQVEYFMWVDSDGSILPAAVGNDSCQAGVVKYPDYGSDQPVIITPVNPKKGVIRLSTDFNIRFAFTGSSICDKSNVWKVEYDKDTKQYAVMIGGVLGNPGPETLDNWFKLEKIEGGYKLVYCPSVCSSCKVMCKDVGTAIDGNGVMRFVLGGRPFVVSFYKVIDD
ncbi:hypothetical protein QVD17_04503 [Tagetes erecta]|uniref:Uncharacterized protein n=1 Tax=Tagetes erecta TaxID=13708 RepID=A0AAD8P9U1_TARER|nr:hypothetical protein QVD17_04503 [Tagetes erecta]